MYKKIISVMSVALMVFLCFNFDIYADNVGPSNRYVAHLPLQNAPDIPESIWPSINLTTFNSDMTGYEENSNVTAAAYYYTVLGQVLLSNTTDEDFKFTGNSPHFIEVHIEPNVNYGNSLTVHLIDYEYLGGQLAISSADEYSNFIFESLDMNSTGRINPILIPAHSKISCYFKLTYCIYDYSSTTFPTPISFGPSTVYMRRNPTTGIFGDYHENYISYIPDLYNELIDIYDRQGVIDQHILAILNAYNANVPASQDLTNESSQASSTIDSQHQTESNYFSNSQSAIQGTGIQNFQFSPQELGGLNGLKDDFTAVWTACGSLSRYWIASLTIGLALAIIRHRRMFEK